jgi:hypothetical protein
MNTLILQFKKVTPLCFIVLALGCPALLPTAQAVSPPVDGDSSTGDTAEGLGDNTAIGADELCNMMLGNTPYGCHALEGNTMGNNNTAIGFNALKDNTTGFHNTAIGSRALGDNAMGKNNTAIGFGALGDNAMGNNNTAIGFVALTCNTGSDNIALGANAGIYQMAGDHNIYIGHSGSMASEDGQIRIGSPGLQTGTYIAGIRNAAVTGSPVVIGMGGKLGVTMSSAQFKEAIKPMDKASESILALNPVTFRYKKEIDPDRIPQFGLVAEDVEKVNPDLVMRDEDGKANTVRYEALNAMLLNEFLKEHRKVEQLEKQVEKLTAGLQKVSARLKLSKSVPQTVLNNQ